MALTLRIILYIMCDMKIVMDTDVIIAAVRSKNGASNRILTLLADGAITAVATVTMLAEYESVMKRSEHLQAAHMTLKDADVFLDTLAALLIPVTPYFLWRPQLKDPDDEMILEAAVNGQADAIVTFNRQDFHKALRSFDIHLYTPSELLRRIRL